MKRPLARNALESPLNHLAVSVWGVTKIKYIIILRSLSHNDGPIAHDPVITTIYNHMKSWVMVQILWSRNPTNRQNFSSHFSLRNIFCAPFLYFCEMAYTRGEIFEQNDDNLKQSTFPFVWWWCVLCYFWCCFYTEFAIFFVFYFFSETTVCTNAIISSSNNNKNSNERANRQQW